MAEEILSSRSDAGGEGRSAQFLLKKLRAKLAATQAEIIEREALADKTREDIAAVSRTLQLFEEMAEETPTHESIPETEVANTVVDAAYGVTRVEDLRDCRYQHEAFRKIAEMNQGHLVLGESVDLVIAALGPKGTRDSVLVSQRRRMQKSDEWERESRGIYRLKKFSPVKRIEAVDAFSATDAEEQSSDENIVVGQHAA